MANLAANGSAESISQFITCPNCEGTGKILASNLDGRVYDHVGSPPSDTPTSESASESTQHSRNTQRSRNTQHSRNKVELMLREIPGIQDQTGSRRTAKKGVRRTKKKGGAENKIKPWRSGRWDLQKKITTVIIILSV